MGIYYYSHWGHLVQTPQISSGFKDKNSRALVFSRVFCFSLNVRQSLAWCPSLLPAAMTIVAILASSRSFSPPGSLLPISYPCLGRLGVRAPSGNLLQKTVVNDPPCNSLCTAKRLNKQSVLLLLLLLLLLCKRLQKNSYL